jgi:DNA-binding Lrp family transcriptional regulator
MSGLPKSGRIDVNILAERQKNGRLTKAALAETVCLSPGRACSG